MPTKSQLTFHATEIDAEGRDERHTARLNRDGLRLFVWRFDERRWAWRLQYPNGHNLPADAAYATADAAENAARNWWAEFHEVPHRAVYILRQGKLAALLSDTSPRTTPGQMGSRMDAHYGPPHYAGGAPR